MKKSLLGSSLYSLAFAAAALALTNSAPAFAQEEAAAPVSLAPQAAVETVDVDPALWVVKDEDTTIYLFGTIHILKPGLGWFDEAVKDAFDASDTLVLEIQDTSSPAAQQAFFGKARAQDGKTLTSRLSEDDRADYAAALAALGQPVAAYEPLKPWAVTQVLGVLPLIAKGYDLESGAEAVLKKAALESGKSIEDLETIEFQLGIFDGLSEEKQIKWLNETVDSIDEVDTLVDNMVTTWGQGDPAALADILNEGLEDSSLKDALLTNRNATWADWIKTRLDEPGTIFIAVGAGHLAGDSSVQQQLTARGIESTRIEY